MKFVLENNQYIPLVLTVFLDDRGIHHPKVKVSRRASYLFMRVVKLLKAKLVSFIETILQVYVIVILLPPVFHFFVIINELNDKIFVVQSLNDRLVDI